MEQESKQVTVVIESQNGENKTQQINLTSVGNVKEQLSVSPNAIILLWNAESNSFQPLEDSNLATLSTVSEARIKVIEVPSSSDNTSNESSDSSGPEKSRSNSFGVKPRSNSGRQMLSTHRKGSKPDPQDSQPSNSNDTPSN